MDDGDLEDEEIEEVEELEEEEEMESNIQSENLINNSYRILLDENWELRDLYEFPHALLQCYSFVYCLDTDAPSIDKEKIDDAIASYQWQTGYSYNYVNIYGIFERQIPKQDQPTIKAIHKASPGWLDLYANPSVMQSISYAIGQMVLCAPALEKLYSKATNLMKKMKKDRIRSNLEAVKATAAELKEINKINAELAKSMGFKNLSALHKSTGDIDASMKLLLAHYRRMMILRDLQLKGKIKFPTTDESENPSTDPNDAAKN
jgi:hypothetical protein